MKKFVMASALFFISFFIPELTHAYYFNFNTAGLLNEAGSILESTSPYWWVNSGGALLLKDGRGSTMQGNAPIGNLWRTLYAVSNPTDTDKGLHPQNIFRLVTQNKWQNIRQQAYFIVNKDNMSTSSNRNQSNGLLLFNRYQDGQNLYYTGVRVDGSAIIKKKWNGAYTTLAEVKNIYPGTYNRESNPNLLPKNKWVGIRSETKNNTDGSVTIKVFLDKGWGGTWELVAEATDKTNPITTSGYGGIRTDFMDVTFEDYRVTEL